MINPKREDSFKKKNLMPQKKTKKKRAKVVVPKLNNVSCPSNMTLEVWQIALRQQQAKKELFVISQIDDKYN